MHVTAVIAAGPHQNFFAIAYDRSHKESEIQHFHTFVPVCFLVQ